MKRIDAIVRTERVSAVVAALRKAGVVRLTVSHVHTLGYGVDPEDYRLSFEEGAAYSEKAKAAPAGEGAETFRWTCSRCHALPDQALHSPGEWPAAVERMRQNMERMGVAGISDQEAGAIAEYLQRAGARE